ncbi:MAG: hypothetical protein K5930_04455 [Treponemataceae bacterium]|nr:hypothetical protein [Treponemataceae bacterium]
MKKALMLVFLVVICSTSLFAFGIGVQGGSNLNGGGGNVAITFKLDNKPWVFAVDGYFLDNYVSLGITADMWIAAKKLSGPFGFFYGWGFAGNIGLGEPVRLGIAARALGGLNLKLLDNFLELYLQLAWQPGISILPKFGVNLWSFPVQAGFRFWLK